MRRIAAVMAAAALLVTGSVAGAGGSEKTDEVVTLRGVGALLGSGAPEDVTVDLSKAREPLGRVQAWMPHDPGTKKWITLDYGPYTVHPGSDLSRVEAEVVGQSGYAVGFEPQLIDETGAQYANHEMHIHHAHWFWLDPARADRHRWIYGTGEERTQGSLWPRAKKDPRFADGLRYGIKLDQGDRISFLSMVHNKTAQPKVVYIRVRIQYVYGDRDSIEEAKGWRFRNLLPVLIGTTYNVPRAHLHTFPLDVTKKTMGPASNYRNPIEDVEVVPGVGQVATMPVGGTIIVGAGHSHPGGKEIVLSNMGRKNDPCPEDGDRFPGVTAVHSRNITHKGVHGSEDYQMGVTQEGWRMHVRKGDRLVINGVYDGKGRYSYPDAMSYFGFYIDTGVDPRPSQACKVELLDDPGAPKERVTWTKRNQPWPEHTARTCTRCDEDAPAPEPGPETNVVHMTGFVYLPGNLGLEGQPLGPPVVERGEEIHFVNEDYALGGVRHSVTSCRAPCNGEYAANYPLHDGRFHSGALGYTWQETYVNAKDEPYWSLDTSKLSAGQHTFFCQLHPWMRGSFYVKE